MGYVHSYGLTKKIEAIKYQENGEQIAERYLQFFLN